MTPATFHLRRRTHPRNQRAAPRSLRPTPQLSRPPVPCDACSDHDQRSSVFEWIASTVRTGSDPLLCRSHGGPPITSESGSRSTLRFPLPVGGAHDHQDLICINTGQVSISCSPIHESPCVWITGSRCCRAWTAVDRFSALQLRLLYKSTICTILG